MDAHGVGGRTDFETNAIIAAPVILDVICKTPNSGSPMDDGSFQSKYAIWVQQAEVLDWKRHPVVHRNAVFSLMGFLKRLIYLLYPPNESEILLEVESLFSEIMEVFDKVDPKQRQKILDFMARWESLMCFAVAKPDHASNEVSYTRLTARTFCFLVFITPILSFSRKAPLYDRWGDVYRGWPVPYGLDQGDVTGEFLFFLAYFSWWRFLIDVSIAVLCGELLLRLLLTTRSVLCSVQQVQR